MAYINLDARTQNIFDLLIDQESYISVSSIAHHFDCSINGVQYSLQKIAALLQEQGFNSLEKVRRQGVKLNPAQREWWRQFRRRAEAVDYVFSPEERTSIIICLLIIQRSRFSVEAVSSMLNVSRNTVFASLRSAKEIFSDYKISLVYDSPKGYALLGDEFTLRSLLIYHYTALSLLVERGILSLFDSEREREYAKKLQEIQSYLEVEFVQGVIEKLVVLLLYIDTGNARQPVFTCEQREEIGGSREYDLIATYFPELSEGETHYLSCQLLGSRVLHPYTQDLISDQSSKTFAKNLVLYFERLTGISLQNRHVLLLDLTTHISRAIYRYKYGIALPYDSSEKVKTKYSDLFAIMEIVVNDLSRDIGYPIDDKETALLASYFFNHIPQLPFHIERVPALLVMEPEDGDAHGLAERIEAVFPMLAIEGILDSKAFYGHEAQGKIVLSTRHLHGGEGHVYIDAELGKSSRDSVYQCYQRYRLGRSLQEVDDLMVHLQPYIHKDSYYRVRNEIMAFLYDKEPALDDILKREYVQTGLTAENWRVAVTLAAQPMLASHSISQTYVQAMIDSISMYGSYSYIFDGVYLAHADCVQEVKTLSLGISTFAKPVTFPGNKPVSLLLVLCPKDKYSHFSAFKELIGVCSEPGNVQRLLNASDPGSILSIIQRGNSSTPSK